MEEGAPEERARADGAWSCLIWTSIRDAMVRGAACLWRRGAACVTGGLHAYTGHCVRTRGVFSLPILGRRAYPY